MAVRFDKSNACPMGCLASGVKGVTLRGQDDCFDALNDIFHKLKENLAALCTQELVPGGFEDLTAVQRDALQKEIDGAVTLRVREEVDSLLGAVIGWYRDLELLRCGGNVQHLMLRDRADALQQAFQSGSYRALEEIERAAAEARTNIARSSPIRSTLESLFLKIGLL